MFDNSKENQNKTMQLKISTISNVPFQSTSQIGSPSPNLVRNNRQTARKHVWNLWRRRLQGMHQQARFASLQFRQHSKSDILKQSRQLNKSKKHTVTR